MHMEQDGMMLVRADLWERLKVVRRLTKRRQADDAADEVAGIRAVALAYGLLPVAHLAEAFQRADCRPDSTGACQSALYLDRLEDAIGCGQLSEEATQAMIASVSVRFS